MLFLWTKKKTLQVMKKNGNDLTQKNRLRKFFFMVKIMENEKTLNEDDRWFFFLFGKNILETKTVLGDKN